MRRKILVLSRILFCGAFAVLPEFASIVQNIAFTEGRETRVEDEVRSECMTTIKYS